MDEKVRIGDRLQSNDPREKGKVVIVTAVFQEPNDGKKYAIYQAGKRIAKIRLDRIFTDSKARHKGYNLVPRDNYSACL